MDKTNSQPVTPSNKEKAEAKNSGIQTPEIGKEEFLSLFKTPSQTPRRRTPKRKFINEESIDNQNRPRTPSGQVLTSSITDIKEALFKVSGNIEQTKKLAKLSTVEERDHDKSDNCPTCEKRTTGSASKRDKLGRN